MLLVVFGIFVIVVAGLPDSRHSSRSPSHAMAFKHLGDCAPGDIDSTLFHQSVVFDPRILLQSTENVPLVTLRQLARTS